MTSYKRRCITMASRWICMMICSAMPLISIAQPAPTPSEDSRQVPSQEGNWTVTTDPETGQYVHTMELSLHRKKEPRPALRYRMIADDFERTNGNAALYYLQAIGFSESTASRQVVVEDSENNGLATPGPDSERSASDPESWIGMALRDLPISEVKDFLAQSEFQRPLLAQAAHRKHYSLDRDLRNYDPATPLVLSELQELLRMSQYQSLRCRVAIREDDIEDAVRILGQQYALANHLSQDDLLLAGFVAVEASNLAWNDFLQLVQQRSTPNLYWALATLPQPLVPLDRIIAHERNLLFLHITELDEIDDMPRPTGYWQLVIDRLVQLRLMSQLLPGLAERTKLPTSGETERERVALVAAIAAAYPGAKRYLVENTDLSHDRIESLAQVQTVLLAIRSLYEDQRDAMWKWLHVPIWQQPSDMRANHAATLRKNEERYGWTATVTTMLLPIYSSFRYDFIRTEQQRAMLQAVEAIRDHAALNDKFPEQLESLRLPAPMDPSTGKPFIYEFRDDHAILSNSSTSSLLYRLVLKLAP